MEYLIAGIRIDIPHRFTTGAFGMALAPFAAENKTETDAGSNRMAGPVPGTATTAAPSPSETPGTERSAPHPATSPADTAQPDLILHTGLLAGDTAGYCELDAFDFTDADADCRFGRDTEGYLLTMTPRDGSAPARFHKAFGSPDATSDITPEHNPALFRFGLWTMFNIAALERHTWHGNVRELRNVVERSLIMADGERLSADTLSPEFRAGAGAPPDSLALDALERHHILKVLEYAKGNKTEAARLLGIGIATLYRKLESYGVK